MWRDKRTGIWQTKIGGRQISLETKNSHVAAQREAKRKVDFGDAIFGLRKPSRIIFYDLAEQYKKSVRPSSKDPKKFERKKNQICRRLEQHIYPEFSNDAVMTITAGRVRQWADRLAVTHSPDGVNRIVTVMRAVVKWGVRNDRMGIPFDPVNHWPKFRAPQDKWTALTASEAAEVLQSDDEELAKIMPMVITALFTGMRSENVVRLRWDQVDLEHGFIRIAADDTKGKDVLTVPILPQVREVLTQAKGNGSPFVFIKANGKPWVPNSVSRVWRFYRECNGLRRVRFHDLRHTFASHLAMQGKSLKVVGDILGHKDPKMTMRYAHLTPEYLKQSVEGFGFCQPNVSRKKHNEEKEEKIEKSED